ncbi:MAG TPA: hypothetical protein VHC69_27915 [Polyangiaceae bacterium]|nr:hypothetical protein [Polyangiaceae bacterium]
MNSSTTSFNSSSAAAPALELSDVSKRFGMRWALAPHAVMVGDMTGARIANPAALAMLGFDSIRT